MLEIKNLYTEIDQTMILKNISFSIDKGQIIGIIGENGSGKSTLFNSILGLCEIKSGEVYLDTENVKYTKKGKRELRKRVSMVMQYPDRQIFYSTVKDELAFPLLNLKFTPDEIEGKIADVCKVLDVKPLLSSFVQNLSFGQKKRVSIASCLMLDLDYLLLDEPTAGLDPRLNREMRVILRDLKEHSGLIVSSHDMDFIYDICDYIYVLKNGEFILEGIKDEVFQNEKLLLDVGLDIPPVYKFQKLLKESEFENKNK